MHGDGRRKEGDRTVIMHSERGTPSYGAHSG